MLTNRIRVGEILLHECLVHHRDFAEVVHFRFREAAATLQVDAEGGEVTIAAKLKQSGPVLGGGLSGNQQLAANAAIRRESAGFSDVHYAGHRFQALQQRTEETSNLRGGFVSILRQRETGHQNVRGVEAEVHLLEREEAAH